MLFTDSHEWIEVADGVGRVGISHHAEQELGEIVYVELPAVGKEIRAGEEIVILESTKAAADIYSPVSGVVIAVNEAVKNQPQLVNELPETDGWLYQIRITHPEELERLMSKAAYHQLIGR